MCTGEVNVRYSFILSVANIACWIFGTCMHMHCTAVYLLMMRPRLPQGVSAHVCGMRCASRMVLLEQHHRDSCCCSLPNMLPQICFPLSNHTTTYPVVGFPKAHGVIVPSSHLQASTIISEIHKPFLAPCTTREHIKQCYCIEGAGIGRQDTQQGSTILW